MNILLFANIGTDAKGFFHVGDEAMFLSTFYQHQKIFGPKTKITAFTHQPNHPDLNLVEIINPIPVHTIDFKYFLKLIGLSLINKYLNLNRLSPSENLLTTTINQQDLIHFCGGGNINSLFRNWLYFSLLTIFIAKIYHVPVILTSQTLGPFRWFDKLISHPILSTAKLITIRQKTVNPSRLLKTKIISTLDAAYNLPIIPIPFPNSTNTKIKIGLSLHSFGSSTKNYHSLPSILTKLNQTTITLIPHIINQDNQFDLEFMTRILATKINYQNPNYSSFLACQTQLASIVKYITGQQDLLITSRYHGIIFALSQNIPCIAIISDPYYHQKNTQALKFFYSDISPYIININQDNFKSCLNQKIKKILQNLKQEKKYLIQKNHILSKTYSSNQTKLRQTLSALAP